MRYYKCSLDLDVGLDVRSASSPHLEWFRFLASAGAEHVFYTDSFRLPSRDNYVAGVRYAVFSECPDLVHYERVNNHSTVFDAEAQGVLCALEYISEFRFNLSYVATDSLSVLKCLASSDPRGAHSTTIYKIKTLVSELAAQCVQVRFVWMAVSRLIGASVETRWQICMQKDR